MYSYVLYIPMTTLVRSYHCKSLHFQTSYYPKLILIFVFDWDDDSHDEILPIHNFSIKMRLLAWDHFYKNYLFHYERS